MRRRLTRAYKLLAVRVVRDHREAANGDKAVFENLVKEDPRVKSIDPALIVLFIRLAMAVWEYFSSRQVSADAPESDDEVLLGAVRFYKG